MNDNAREIFVKQFKKWLSLTGKTQADVSRGLNIPKTTVANWYHGVSYPRSILGVKKDCYSQALFISFTIFSMLLSDIPLYPFAFQFLYVESAIPALLQISDMLNTLM